MLHLLSASVVRETLDTCFDLANWTDINGDSCSWYTEEGSNRCELFGNEFENGGHTANSACCDCGGSPSNSTVCIDDEHYEDPSGFTCADYTRDNDVTMIMDDVLYDTGKTRCELFTELFEDISDLEASPQEKCCACGGGYASEFVVPSFAPASSTGSNNDDTSTSIYEHEECRNVVDWIDATGRFDCPYFEVDPEHRCATYGHYNLNMGHVANSACCACSGGINPTKMYFPEAPAGTTCIDRPHWSAEVGNIQLTCDAFYDVNSDAEYEESTDIDNYYSCEQFGNVLSSTSSSSARQACCRCNGGFNGTLIGKTLRVSFPEGADSLYALFTNSTTNEKDGSTVQFMKDVAKSAGFGMYETDLSDVAKAESPKDSFQACRLDVELGNTDICIGPLWDMGVHDLASGSLYTDSFYLVVPKTSESFFALFMAPIMPFSMGAWGWVIATCLYMSLAIYIMRSHKDPNANEMSLAAKICGVIYSSIKSCVSGDVHDSKNYNPSTPEKIVVAGFVIFALIILTAYSATTAAFLVSVRGGSGAYTSMDDLLKEDDATICVHVGTLDMFKEEFPAAITILEGKDYDTRQLLDALKTDECDAVAVIADHVSYLHAVDDYNVCADAQILYQNSLLDLDIQIPAYPLLSDMGKELVGQMNLLIDEGVYDRWHFEYVNRLVIAGEDASGELNPDQQSYIAAASTMTTSGSYLASLCGSLIELDLEKFELGAKNLFMPIVLSLVCSTVGLIVYMLSRAKGSTALKKKAVAAKMLELNEREEEKLLRQELEETAPFELFTELKEMFDRTLREESDEVYCRISNHAFQIELKEAVDALPDKQKLVNIAFRMKCSDDIQEYLLIGEELDLAELCLLADVYRGKCGMLDDSSVSEYFNVGNHHPVSTAVVDTESRVTSITTSYLTEGTSTSIPNGGNTENDHVNDNHLRKTRTMSLRSAVMNVSNKRNASAFMPPSVKDCLNNTKDPKGVMVHGLFRCLETRRVAVHCAKQKKEARLSNASGVLEFDISEHIDFVVPSLDEVESCVDAEHSSDRTFTQSAKHKRDSDVTVRHTNTDSPRTARSINGSGANATKQPASAVSRF
eukprot:CAMPEP_0196810058 /NCGR_PEP_ID=MMETSP1362-20130617/9897_1 /TAXON_ID=163516 /ORGANISM="Leptocylindrus danicus, Strain CCMP1856" /LENGTH=1085 /DNA_ID=CAMNT_0042184921 /DNA_START=84 /DNA_END=3341 /DNA_ORIENTATION=-